MNEPAINISVRTPLKRLWLLPKVVTVMLWLRVPEQRAVHFANWCLSHLYIDFRVGEGEPWQRRRLSDLGTLKH